MSIDPPIVVVPPKKQAQVVLVSRLVLAVGYFSGGSPDPATIELVDLTPAQELALEAPGVKTLAVNGTVTVTPPPPLPAITSVRFTIDTEVPLTTLDAAPTVLLSRLIPTLTLFDIDMQVHAISRTNGAVKTFWRRAKIKRLGAATAPFVVGSVRTPTPDESEVASAGWLMVPTFLVNNLVITVTGQVGQTIDWSLFADVRRFTPGGV